MTQEQVLWLTGYIVSIPITYLIGRASLRSIDGKYTKKDRRINIICSFFSVVLIIVAIIYWKHHDNDEPAKW